MEHISYKNLLLYKIGMMYIEAKGCMKMFCASSKEHAKKQLTLKKWYNSQRKSWKYMLN